MEKKLKKKWDSRKGDFKKYKDGTVKMRTITPSYGDLKLAQQRIKYRILNQISLPKNVHGGVKKKSNVTNAKVHQGNKFVFVTDLQDFYPGISSDMVYKTLLSLGYSNYFASFLTKLTTWNHCLPQGTPTSTHLSNLVFLKTDEELIELCKKNNITYTRYVDDLTFSSSHDFREHIDSILKIILKGGYKISYRKTQYGGKTKNGEKYRPLITGIELYPNKIEAPSKIIERANLEIDIPLKPVTNYLNNIRKTNTKIYR